MLFVFEGISHFVGREGVPDNVLYICYQKSVVFFLKMWLKEVWLPGFIQMHLLGPKLGRAPLLER